ncbi:MAG: PHP domain-containing protein [Oscillospiraceae bacterium]|nr:PHP domain-containing protein [Oscillospiraceae bacterium]MDD4369005.1 PHP domain-containing protein [Oscillospiraceae bacterium]
MNTDEASINAKQPAGAETAGAQQQSVPEETAASAAQVAQTADRLGRYIREAVCDLHIHTNASDGFESPSQVVVQALHRGLGGFSVTDHDTVQGDRDVIMILDKLQQVGLPLPHFVAGVELSTAYDGGEIHLLGYFLDEGFEKLEPFLRRCRASRAERNRAMCEALQEMGFLIDYHELNAQGGYVVGRVHMANILIRKGYAASVHECFDKWLGDGRLAFRPRALVPAAETIKAIRACGGVPVLAHPADYGWCGGQPDPLSQDTVLLRHLRQLQALGLVGVETVHGRATPQQMSETAQAARQLGLLRTAGSDYHDSQTQRLLPYIFRADNDFSLYLL